MPHPVSMSSGIKGQSLGYEAGAMMQCVPMSESVPSTSRLSMNYDKTTIQELAICSDYAPRTGIIRFYIRLLG